MTQVAATAVAAAVVSSFSTVTTLVLSRYLPKALDGAEKTLGKVTKIGNGNGSRSNKDKKTEEGQS
jgi:hypothetical protein